MSLIRHNLLCTACGDLETDVLFRRTDGVPACACGGSRRTTMRGWRSVNIGGVGRTKTAEGEQTTSQIDAALQAAEQKYGNAEYVDQAQVRRERDDRKHKSYERLREAGVDDVAQAAFRRTMDVTKREARRYAQRRGANAGEAEAFAGKAVNHLPTLRDFANGVGDVGGAVRRAIKQAPSAGADDRTARNVSSSKREIARGDEGVKLTIKAGNSA